MRIAVDARQIFRDGRRGTGKNLIDLYETLARRRPDWHVVLFHQFDVADPPLADLPNVRRQRVDIPGERFNLWEQLRLPAAAFAAGADLLHAPANTGPRFPCVPLVVTIHDLIPLELNPDAPATRLWLRRVTAAARKARHVVTPSDYSKRQLVARLGLPPEKITVNPWAADRKTRRVTDAAALDRVRQKYGLAPGEPYCFGYGAADPRKNTRGLLEAFAALPPDAGARLLLVGIQEPALTAFRARAAELGLGSRAVLHGFADEADMPALLSGARLLCFPSRSEGFGLPILDAFACETPVLTSDRTSLPEVAADAALLIDPDDPGALRAGLARLLADDGLCRRLVERGRERLALYTWDRCADALARVFETVATARPTRTARPRAAGVGY